MATVVGGAGPAGGHEQTDTHESTCAENLDVRRELAAMKQSIPPAGTDPLVPGQFRVSERGDKRHHVIALSGELDVASAPGLRAQVVELCAGGARSIAIDLGELTFIDSAGLRAIMRAKSLCEEQSCDFSLVPGSKSIQRVFALTGLLEYLPFVEDSASAGIANGEEEAISQGAPRPAQRPASRESG